MTQDEVASEDLDVRRATVANHNLNKLVEVGRSGRSELVQLNSIALQNGFDEIRARDHKARCEAVEKANDFVRVRKKLCVLA